MDNCKEIIAKAGIIPDLQLAIQITDEAGNKKGVKGTGPHRVKLIDDKVVMGSDYLTGAERHEVMLIVEEDGQKKKYCFPVKDKKGGVHYLVQKFADIKPGEEVILEYKKCGAKGYIDVQKVEKNYVPEIDDIPVIEDEEDEKYESLQGNN